MCLFTVASSTELVGTMQQGHANDSMKGIRHMVQHRRLRSRGSRAHQRAQAFGEVAQEGRHGLRTGCKGATRCLYQDVQVLTGGPTVCSYLHITL